MPSSTSSGTDTIISSIDRDLQNILADVENVTLEAGAGDINAYGQDLNNTLTGNEGANILDGRDGSDTLEGGAGDDIYYVRNYTDANTSVSYSDSIVEAEFDAATGLISQGNDTVVANSSYTLGVGVAVEVMETLSASGTGGWALTGNEFVQTITGNNGNNTLDGGVDAVDPSLDDGVVDTLTGGGGNDTYVIRDQSGAALDTLVEDVDAGSDTISSTVTRDLIDATFDNIENITLTGATDADATGDDANNTLTGNDGVNVLNGKAGTDVLTGGAAADTFVWDGNGRDVVNDFSNSDVDLVSLEDMHISEYSTLQALAFNTTTTVGSSTVNNTVLRTVTNSVVHTMMLKGLALADTSASTFVFDTATTDDTVNGSATDDYLFAAAGNDTLNGLAGVDVMFGEAGNDELDGGLGNDRMYGGAGNDIFHVNSLSDQVFDSTSGGTDTIYTTITLALPTVAATKDIENLGVEGSTIDIVTATSSTASVTTNALNLTGNALANIIAGNDGANVLNGGAGADTLVGGAGNDVYYIDNAADAIVDEGAGNGTADRVFTRVNYTLGNGDQVEFLNAWGTSATNLTGNNSAQTITGNAANNVVNGGLGSDTLWGLGGSDSFLFNTALGATNKDTIKDFNAAADTVRIDNAIFTAVRARAPPSAKFYQGTAAHDADDRIIYNRVTGELAYDADGNGSGAAVTFAVISNKVAMTNADFVIV